MTTPVTPVADAALPLPDPADLGTWGARMAEMHRWMREDLRTGMNALGEDTYTNALASVAAANNKGAWSGLTGALSVPASVAHAGGVWMLLSNVADVTAETPGVSAAWLEITPLKEVDVAMLATTQFGFRNRVVNGNFAINQGGVSGSVVLAAGAYGHDQWKAGAAGCTYTFSTSGGVNTLNITAGSLIQPIEGVSLRTGTHTLSWTGTAQGKIGAGSYSASGVTGSVTGGADTTIEFNTGTLSLVQLENGSTATVFEFMDPSTDLIRCMRYYETGKAVFRGYSHTAGGYGIQVYYKVEKRATPTVTKTDTAGAGFPSAGSVFEITKKGHMSYKVANADVLGAYFDQPWVSNARM